MKVLNPDQDESEEEDGSASMQGLPEMPTNRSTQLSNQKSVGKKKKKQASLVSKLKKSPSQIKTEYLQKLFSTNERGHSLHDREL